MYLIGSYKPSFVPKFKRTSMYTEQDFHWLNEYVSKFSRIVVTPQVLAEAWNFLEKISGRDFQEFLERALSILYIMHEDYNSKDELFASDGFKYIGVTDSSVIYTAKKLGCLVLTDDLRAYSYFSANEVMTININHLRQL
jgi:predicted nucleic acid-binding protein